MDLQFDQPIAEREIERSDGGPDVIVKLGPPRPMNPDLPDAGWYCPYRIESLDAEPLVSFGAGIDGIQAIILSLAKIGDYLNSRTDAGLNFLDMDYCGFLSAKLPPVAPVADR